MDLGVYIHIPFCRSKCAYCDFNSYADLEHLADDYVTALEQEVGEAPGMLGELGGFASTIYLGGGTPSLLTLGQVDGLLSAVGRALPLRPDAEVTLEANPGTVDLPYLRGLRALGVNRLSLGVQSLDDRLLKAVGRIHTARQAREAYFWARQAGHDNIGLDFIFGLPGQDLLHWERTLYDALALEPEHFSLYALTIDEETPLGRELATGHVSVPDDDSLADMYELAERLLASAGYAHYEISSWARREPDARSRHNLVYWRNEPYLGFGAGAHSSLPGGPGGYWVRWHNVAAPEVYVERSRRGETVVGGTERLPMPTAMAETAFLGLRLVEEGLSRRRFSERFGRDVLEVFGEAVKDLDEAGLVECSAERIRLTPKGRLLGNEAFLRFVS